jgi:hypothetical protein
VNNHASLASSGFFFFLVARSHILYASTYPEDNNQPSQLVNLSPQTQAGELLRPASS